MLRHLQHYLSYLPFVINCLFAWFFLVAVFSPTQHALRFTALLTLATTYLIFYVLKRPSASRESHQTPRPALSIPLIILTFCLHFFLAESFAYDPNNNPADAGTIYRAAQFRVYDSVNHFQAYLSTYPNNFSLYLLNIVLVKTSVLTGISYVTLSIFLNVLVLQLAFWLTLFFIYKTISYRAAVFSYVALFILICTSPYSYLFYTDSLGMIFPLAIFLLGFTLTHIKSPLRQDLIILGLIFLTLIGLTLKPTIIFVPLALLIAYFLKFRPSFRSLPRPRLIRLSLITGIIFAAFYLSHHFLTQKLAITLSADKAASAIHFFRMGLVQDCSKNNTCTYGTFNDYDGKLMEAMSVNSSIPKYNQDSLGVIAQRLWQMPLTTYPAFLLNKLTWVHTDGSFNNSIGANGLMESAIYQDAYRLPVQAIFHPAQPYYWLGLLLKQIIWVFILFCLGILPLYRAYKTSRITPLSALPAPIITIYLTLALFLLFQAFFEASPRYPFMFLPLFVILAVYSHNAANKA